MGYINNVRFDLIDFNKKILCYKIYVFQIVYSVEKVRPN